jgi:hypothetical protein
MNDDETMLVATVRAFIDRDVNVIAGQLVARGGI